MISSCANMSLLIVERLSVVPLNDVRITSCPRFGAMIKIYSGPGPYFASTLSGRSSVSFPHFSRQLSFSTVLSIEVKSIKGLPLPLARFLPKDSVPCSLRSSFSQFRVNPSPLLSSPSSYRALTSALSRLASLFSELVMLMIISIPSLESLDELSPPFTLNYSVSS